MHGVINAAMMMIRPCKTRDSTRSALQNFSKISDKIR